MVQHRAIRFISTLKGKESVTEARKKLKLETLADRRTKIRHALLLRLLSHEENNESLISAYDELINDRPANVAVTRAVTPEIPQRYMLTNQCTITVSYQRQFVKPKQSWGHSDALKLILMLYKIVARRQI